MRYPGVLLISTVLICVSLVLISASVPQDDSIHQIVERVLVRLNKMHQPESELVKIKPGTILYARLQHTILQRDTFDLLLCDIQELCLKVKSVILSPSRKHCVYIEILFDPIPLNRQIKIKSTTIQRIWIAIISNSEISIEGVIEWK